ncbi:head GIN domain-containing protein [Emticicia soli]|uniref:Head GIN domain-containing protein n=1 Tax=Emticicia soli TaxID=2027878 RepID=A0ABW5J4X0_9BACT
MKKPNLGSIIAIALLVFSISSCGLLQQGIEPRNPDEKTFDLRNFDKLEMGNAFNINVKQGSNYRVIANGDSRDINDLVVRVSGGELEIYYKKWRVRRYRMEIEIEMPTLKEVDFSGATTSYINGFDNIDELDIDLSGSSRATIYAKARTYEIDLSGASELELEGSGQLLEADLSGASKLNAFDTQVVRASLEVSGASSGRVNVSERLNVRASGASKVKYRGNPEVISNLSGSSHVERD